MAFRITGLSPKPFQHLFGLPDDELAKHGARRCVADEVPGFPCRIEMRDAELGETLLLLNHTCQPADTPYPRFRMPSSCAKVQPRLITKWIKCRRSCADVRFRYAPMMPRA